MTIPVMQFRPLSGPAVSPVGSGLRNLSKSLMQGIAMQQQLQNQHAQQQLIPLQKKLLEAKIQSQQNPGDRLGIKDVSVLQGREFKQALDLSKAVSDDPSLLSIPGISDKLKEAQLLISEHPFMTSSQQQQQQIVNNTQTAQQTPVEKNQIPSLSFEDHARLIEEYKNTPTQMRSQQTRSTSAKVLSGELRQTLDRLKPFFGTKNSLKKAVRLYSSKLGLSNDESSRLYQTLEKTINGLTGEATAGLTGSRAVEARKEIENLVDPRTSSVTSYDQVIRNLDALDFVLDANHGTLFLNSPINEKINDHYIKTQLEKHREYLNKIVPRATQLEQNKGITPEIAIQELKKPGKKEKSTLDSVLESAFSGIVGGKKGLLDIASGAGKRIAPMLGLDPSRVPNYQPSQLEANILQQHPIASSIGRFGGETLGLVGAAEALPEEAFGAGVASLARMIGLGSKGASRAGTIGKIAGTGGALGTIVDPDSPISESAATGAILNLGTAGLANLALKSPRAASKLLKMGGAAKKEGVEEALDASKNLGVNLPLGEIIKSPGISKIQKVGLKNIPGSGMSQEYENIAEGLKGQVQSLLKKLNPENEHSGEVVKDFLTQKYNRLKSEVGDLYSSLASKVNSEVPGEPHEIDNLYKSAQLISKELSQIEKVPGGKIKSPQKVKNIINEISKGNTVIDRAFLQDEVINENIGDALAKISKGGEEARDGRREIRYFKKLKEANLQDIDNTIEKIGRKDIAQDWKKAKNFFEEEIAPFEQRGSILGKIISKTTNKDDVRSLFLKTSGQQPKSEILKQVAEQLPQNIKDKVAHDYLIGQGEGGLMDVLKAHKKLQKKQRDLLLADEDKNKLDSLLTLKKHIGDEFNQMFVPKTGAQAPMVLGAIGAAEPLYDVLEGKDPTAAVGRSLALIGGARGLRKALMSNALKKMYLNRVASLQKPARKTLRGGLPGLTLMDKGDKNKDR